jgi:hypothetical protein
MSEPNSSRYSTGNAVCDALRYINDAAYAVLPQDVAHKLGELEKNFWSGLGHFVGKELQWIDERVAGSDRLRHEWRERARRAAGETNAGSDI